MLGLHRLTAWDRAASRQCNRINHHRTGDIFAFVSHSSVGEERPLYLNSGDWVENGTALKYAHGQWQLVRFDQLVDDGDVIPQRLEETRAVG